MLSPLLVLLVLGLYFGLLMLISWWHSRDANQDSFYTGNRNSPWYIVAIGMVGAALSGVTFVSLPGTVATNQFHLAQFIFGNIFGYILIAFVLIPLYYRLRLVSIYGYLHQRFGNYANKTGAGVFIISQSFGAALRMLLAVKVLQVLFFDNYGIPLPFTAVVMLTLIWLYTRRAGIKVIVWTDLLQTISLLLAVFGAIIVIINQLDLNWNDVVHIIKSHPDTKVIEWDVSSPNNFWKQFVSGILISLAMMGIDQNMMQKSLTCKNVNDARKNVLTFSLATGLVQLLFLFLGLGLYLYIDRTGITLPDNLYEGGKLVTDRVFPYLANHHFGLFSGICFLVGVVATAFSSADSSLTALTTSFSYDFANITNKPEKTRKRIRQYIHITFSLVVLMIIILFSHAQGDIFSVIFKVAGYTYGPLLGLFLLGIVTKWKIEDHLIPWMTIAAPIITYFLQVFLKEQYGFDIGFSVILVNSLLFIALLCVGSFLWKQTYKATT